MEYNVAFTFSTLNEADTLSAQLTLSGSNAVSLTGNQPIQVQQITSDVPSAALDPLNVLQKSIAIQAAKNTDGNAQYVKVVVPIKTGDSNLTGNFPYSGTPVKLQYKFIGYSAAGSISVGDFSIPFPD